MAISPETVEKIAHLARLPGETNEKNHKIQQDLNNIVQMVDQISNVPTDGIQPMWDPLDRTQPFREDNITEANQQKVLLKLAPNAEAGLFLVPPVIE